MQVETDSLVQGLELRPLNVYPPHEGDNATQQGAATPDARFAAAQQDELNAGPCAEVLTKQLMRALAACRGVDSSMLLVAVGEDRPMVHLLCVFHEGEDGPKTNLALHVWLPVRSDGD